MPETIELPLPESLARRRSLNIQQTAAFVGKSVPEIRRLVRLGKFPKPFRQDLRQLSWTIGSLVDHIDSKANS